MTCDKKPLLHAGIKYDKISSKSATAGELGLVFGQAASGNSKQVPATGRRRRKKVAGGKSKESSGKMKGSVTAGFIELASPATNGVCSCTLELENTSGAKMRVQLRSITMPDLAAISRSFWNPSS